MTQSLDETQTGFVAKAHATTQALRALFEPTPLQRSAYLSDLYEAEIYLKREDLSPVRSYKIRGAMTAVSHHMADQSADSPPKRFICASAGNHAQGVAYACRHFGVEAIVFMPVTTPQQKIDKTRAFGEDFVRVELIGDYFDDALKAAQEYAAKEGAIFLPPYDSQEVILGQSSVAVEMLEQLGHAPDMLVLPVGGGGLSAGTMRYMQEAGALSDLYLVEPLGARCLYAALMAGVPVRLPNVDNFVDGASVAQIGDANFEVLHKMPAQNVRAIDENRLCTTMLKFLNHEGIVLEPAGALTIDLLKDLGARLKGKTVVCVTSGGNFDFDRLPDVRERALKFEGLKKYFILRLPQRPGALKDFLGLLGPQDDIVRFEYLKKSARNFGSVLLGIETKDPANFAPLTTRMEEMGFTFEDITTNQILAEFLI